MSAKMMLNCLKSSLFAAFLLFFQVIEAQPNFSGVETIIKQNQKAISNDITVIVYKDGKNIYVRENPEFRLKNPAPVYQSSRWFTAAVVMVLVDEGKLSLDDPVSKYLPIFDKYFKGYITVRQCLANTTGIQAEASGVMKLAQKNRFASLEEEVNAFVSKREIQDNAGTAYFYSNIGPNIAGRVLEIVAKKSFDRVAQEKLFRPLGMRNSSFYAEKGSIDPSEGATSSAFDFANFLAMLLNNGQFNGKKILSEESVAFLKTQQFPDVPVKFMPKEVSGFTPVPGAWVESKAADGSPALMSSPGFSGVLPWIDFEKKYAAVIFPKNELSEEKRKPIMQLRKEIEDAL